MYLRLVAAFIQLGCVLLIANQVHSKILQMSENEVEGKVYIPDEDNFLVEDLPQVERRNDFFLKASKSIPRIGRRNDFFFAKNLKSVPRIGRRNDFFMKTVKSVPKMGKRDLPSSIDRREVASSWPWYRERIPGIVKKGSGMIRDDSEGYLEQLDINQETAEPRLQPLTS